MSSSLSADSYAETKILSDIYVNEPPFITAAHLVVVPNAKRAEIRVKGGLVWTRCKSVLLGQFAAP